MPLGAKRVGSILGLVLTGTLLFGCAPEELPVEELPAPIPNLDYLVGTDYPDLSKNFDLTIYPAVLYEKADGQHVSFRFAVANKSPARFNEFSASLELASEFYEYLQTEDLLAATPAVDLTPKTIAKAGSEVSDQSAQVAGSEVSVGVELRTDAGINSPAELAMNNFSPQGILSMGSETALVLTWDGGEETHYVDLEIQDPDNLLGAN